MKHSLGDSALGILGIWRTGVSRRRAEGARPLEINRNILTFVKSGDMRSIGSYESCSLCLDCLL